MTLAELELLHDESGRPWLLGSGNFGAVYRALLRGKEEVAVKVRLDQAIAPYNKKP